MRRGTLIEELMAFEEWMERKEELKKKKTEVKKPRESKGLGFFEGLVVAYVAQILYGPLTKIAEFYFQIPHGVH